MGMLSPPKPPSVQLPPPSAHVPTLGSASAQSAAARASSAATDAEGQGFDDTVKTSPQGLKPPQTAKTTLLGGG